MSTSCNYRVVKTKLLKLEYTSAKELSLNVSLQAIPFSTFLNLISKLKQSNRLRVTMFVLFFILSCALFTILSMF